MCPEFYARSIDPSIDQSISPPINRLIKTDLRLWMCRLHYGEFCKISSPQSIDQSFSQLNLQLRKEYYSTVNVVKILHHSIERSVRFVATRQRNCLTGAGMYCVIHWVISGRPLAMDLFRISPLSSPIISPVVRLVPIHKKTGRQGRGCTAWGT